MHLRGFTHDPHQSVPARLSMYSQLSHAKIHPKMQSLPAVLSHLPTALALFPFQDPQEISFLNDLA